MRAGTPRDSAPGGARTASPRLRTAGAEVRVGMPRGVGQEGEPETGEDRDLKGRPRAQFTQTRRARKRDPARDRREGGAEKRGNPGRRAGRGRGASARRRDRSTPGGQGRDPRTPEVPPQRRSQRVPASTHHVKREGQAEQKEPQVEVERVHEGGLVRVVVPAAAQRGPHPLPEDLQRLRPHPHPASPPPPSSSPPGPQFRPRCLLAQGPV